MAPRARWTKGGRRLVEQLIANSKMREAGSKAGTAPELFAKEGRAPKKTKTLLFRSSHASSAGGQIRF